METYWTCLFWHPSTSIWKGYHVRMCYDWAGTRLRSAQTHVANFVVFATWLISFFLRLVSHKDYVYFIFSLSLSQSLDSSMLNDPGLRHGRHSTIFLAFDCCFGPCSSFLFGSDASFFALIQVVVLLTLRPLLYWVWFWLLLIDITWLLSDWCMLCYSLDPFFYYYCYLFGHD